MSRFDVKAVEDREKQGLVHPCNLCAVREFTVCAPLDDTNQARMAAIMTRTSTGAGGTIFDEAEPARHVFNITAGAVKVYKLLADGRRAITGFLFPGDFLGLTLRDAYAYTAEAIEDTTLCRFPREKLERLLDDAPVLERRLLGLASHELAAAQDQMLLLGRKTARERLASFLILLSNAARRHGRPADPVEVPMSRGDIADYLGLTIETVSRSFSQMKRDGLIQLLDGNRVHLAKEPAIRVIANLS